ncbi:thymidine phosphorylase [Stenotrophomonas maltophilia]|nr:thymidine phosphorylase [Stenotrophomonas maltophilia]
MPSSPPPMPEDTARFAAVDAPPRVRRLLGVLLALSRQSLTAPLTLTVVELERELLREAERARNSQVQADLFAQARQIHPFAEGFSHRFLAHLAQALAALFAPASEAPAAAEPQRPSMSALTLVNDTDIDRNIVLNEIMRREMLRSANALQLLGQRLAVLAAAPALDAEHVPFGPVILCGIVRRIGDEGGLELEAQLALYRSFERQVLERLGELLERANVLLGHEGVLPGLVYTPYLARSAATRRIVTQPGRGPGSGAARARTTPVTSWNGASSTAASSWSAMMQAELGGHPPPTDAAASMAPQPPPLPTGAPDRPATAAPVVDLAAPAMSALHELLAGARHAMAAGAAASPGLEAPLPGAAVDHEGGMPGEAPDANTVPSAMVDAILGQLQARIAGGATARSMSDLQTALLTQLRAEHGEQAALTVKDGDTLDLLGLLFQQIRQEQRPQTAGNDLVGRLQVPLARAALADPGFFVRDEHPARELLNTIAELGASGLQDDDLDPQLVQKLERTVDTVVAQYHDDPAVFAAANEEVQQHFRAAAHKAELAERRHVEAARGKERLEVARQQATTLIEQACAQDEPPRFVQTLLRQAWADVLTLSQLRHGEDSALWQQRLQQTARITAVTAQAPGGEHAADDILFGEIEAAVLQIGCHHDEARAIARRLSTPGGEDDSTSRTELTARLKARTRLGEHAEAHDTRRLAPLARSNVEEDCYRQLRTLPFGTWFEFISNQQGDLHRQRLSWYSLVTEHALFVNPRGQKVAEYTLDTLARLMALEQARIVTEDKGRLIDRAWQATLRTLRSLAGTEQGEAA